ncbi:sulfotransferase [Thiorhodovibrio frisius]|uniref:Sulfotransferase family protein n=1 Tax=Thiorhodovibrio frisius TaxID=631362 RepID=H8Z1X6_9GAMM|nr:sulfotransferase [Thiorhodovibrio frisius]EIC22604.1 hypothetical protein Thi970DRAFT_02878 [Thiorhodovibrio frisius]WPL20045.1 hypothetical protein Thiofri_00098 [Thiorhodovibrio frisius]
MNTEPNSITARTALFSRNVALETLLKDLNATLWQSEQAYLAEPVPPSHPIILVMGPMRSGTTLFMQWLANTGLVAYPTNLLSRFYQAPIIGAKIQLLLTDPRYNFRNELGEFLQQIAYHSENGKTQGVLAPNEFWYFWRRFLPEPSRDVWLDDELRQGMDIRTLLAELAGLITVFQKPFATKAMLFNYNIPFLDALFDQVLFIHIQRDPVANVASVLDARKRQLGSETAWYSFKIPEYEELRTLDPIPQVAGQVLAINRAVTSGLEDVAEHRKLNVDYEAFCADPKSFYDQIVLKLGMQAAVSPYSGRTSYTVSRLDDLPNRSAIQRAVKEYVGEVGGTLS